MTNEPSEDTRVEKLKKGAKTLLKSVREQVSRAVTRVSRYLDDPQSVTLQQVQLVVVRELGFSSWDDMLSQTSETRDEYEETRKVIETLKQRLSNPPKMKRVKDEPPTSGDPSKLLHCSFCGNSQHEVRKLIAGPSVYVCDERVILCLDILADWA